MNIFYLSKDPEKAAWFQCDKHIVKMPLETAQMLCTAHRELDGDEYADEQGLYKRAYWNHPCTIWARESRQNYQWLITKKDEFPTLDKKGLEKFFEHGYDQELGWVRKPNTSHEEIGKHGKTFWSIDQKGSRKNPSNEISNSKISCYGDSFTFGRQVNNNETWEYYFSKLSKTNIQNFGVGNYGIDQALLRLKREFPHNKTKIVLMGVVPDTISRILSMWKHYYEYGNTFGFKPKFGFSNNKLNLLTNPINNKKKFSEYQKFLPYVQKNDYFFKNKFKKEIIYFPYSFTILRNFSRNFKITKFET